MTKNLFILSLLLIISLMSFVFALSVGSYPLLITDIIQTLLGKGQTVAQSVIYDLRLPRAYIAYVTGGLLALAGALMQVLLRNPLADPYILGVSGGASVAALLAMSSGLAGFWVSGSAFAGALLSILLVFGIAQGKGHWNPTRLLLTGVVIGAGWGAAINFILSVSPDEPLRGMLFWLMGDISNISPNINGLLALIIGLLISFSLARQLNILSRGELQAGALGVAVKPLRIGLFFLASALTAFAVTQAGSVGFIGLIIPHMIRLICGSDHRILIPSCVLLGGSMLLVSDTLARTIIAPQQLPVGVITALIGVPFFLFLLNRSVAGKQND